MTPLWSGEQPVLSDGGVALRPWEPGDAGGVFRACQDPDIQRYTRVPVPYLLQHAESFVSAVPGWWADRTGAAFAVVGVAEEGLLGGCGLVEVDVAAGVGWAGYWVAPWARGRGVARTSLVLLTRWALGEGGLSRIVLEIEESNAASLAVAAGAGYERVGPPVAMDHRGVQRLFLTYEARTP